MPSKKISITYIIYNIDKASEFEWVVECINKDKYIVDFISINSSENTSLREFCLKNNTRFYHVPYSGKKDLPSALWKIIILLRKNRPDIVHAHLFEGGLIGITAAFIAGIPKRIYTRHYATQHHEYAASGVKYDKLINRLSTDIIAISENVKDVLINMEGCPFKKIHLIHHGFPLENFSDVSIDRIDAVKKKYDIHTRPVIGVVSRYLHLKGIQYIIPAFKNLLIKYPSAVLVLANAKGEYKSEIHKLLQEIPKGSFREIAFESDNAALFKCFDVFIHVPINKRIEAFGQIYVEALAAEIPSIFTLSGVASEFIENRKNAMVVDFQSSEQIYSSLLELLENETLRINIIKNGKDDIKQFFSLHLKINKLEELYVR